jgi:hypothetical protein
MVVEETPMSQGWSMGAGIHGLSFIYLVGTAGMLWAMNRAKRSFWLFSLLVFPGTLGHELCHWLMGILLRGHPVRFTVVPRREGHGWALGSVAFGNLRWYNAFFIGLAPLLLLIAAYGLFLWRVGAHPALGWSEAGLVYLLANLLFGAVPSWQDLRMVARSPIGWLLLAGALIYGWMRFLKPTADGPAKPSARFEETMWARGCPVELPLPYEVELDKFSGARSSPGKWTAGATGRWVGGSRSSDTNPFSWIAVCSKPIGTNSPRIASA